jgi:hypothetical protein
MVSVKDKFGNEIQPLPNAVKALAAATEIGQSLVTSGVQSLPLVSQSQQFTSTREEKSLVQPIVKGNQPSHQASFLI